MGILRRIVLLIVLLGCICFTASAETLSVEQQVYNYLTQVMELPSSSACGVLANMVQESAFNANALGDKGTSYGLCQWHAGRYNALKKYCQSIGLDYQTVEGQLEYLSYELRNSYPGLLNTLRTMEDTSNGAYQAGYIWCVQFERPVNMEKRGVSRGTLAKEKYWNRYNSMVVVAREEEPLTQEEVVRIVRQKEITVPQPPEDMQAEYREEPGSGKVESQRLTILHYIPRHRPKEEWHGNPVTGFAAAVVFMPLSDGKKERFELNLPEQEPSVV